MGKKIVINERILNFIKYEGVKTVYSGNVWWSTSDYIKRLSPNIGKKYTDPEFWITSRNMIKKKKINYLSLWNSNVNHYHTIYKKEKYINKKYFKTYTNWDLIESNME